ncbi:LpqN/LpqT family lipoprotein [Mycolicibacterium sp. 050158]|uniref:LpqN/LpqT family lipoprotein n=1 Tax=Mycolicibacterium sp. 050158 TaxID=3090602 RepID=UPI00299EA2FD|nr:LpqN/LpqT family lipoprotein [Mycolicibacterium sp. 050158]MDX1890396.1 LpqN/LpqT family lipoprotein [Mycolicibacterium sp. 050158]
MRRTAIAAVALAALALAGCAPTEPDYKSIWTTTTSATATSSAEKPISLSTWFENAGVTGAPVAPDKLTDLAVTVPQPPGWKPYFNPNLSPGTRTIAKGDTYPTAMLLVFQLDGPFDVGEALKHADGDALLSQNFTKLNDSKKDFMGFPSSMIEGTYDLNGQRMQSYNRIVIASGTPARANLPGQKYLVQLTVTAFADKAQADGADIEAIIKGFTVTAK